MVLPDGRQIPNFIINNTPYPIEYRFEDGYKITLPSGYFWPIFTGAKGPNYVKYYGQKRFKLI